MLYVQKFEQELKTLEEDISSKQNDTDKMNQDYEGRKQKAENKFLEIYHYLLSILCLF